MRKQWCAITNVLRLPFQGAQHPTISPYTLHPTPYTPHPTPYTLHPTPYTPHPTLDTLPFKLLTPQPKCLHVWLSNAQREALRDNTCNRQRQMALGMPHAAPRERERDRDRDSDRERARQRETVSTRRGQCT